MSNETYLRNPSEQKFYRVIAVIMGSLGLNTHYWSWFQYPANKCYFLQRKLIIVFVPIAFTSMVMYLASHYKDHQFTVLASILSVIPYTFNITCKVLIAQTASYKTAQTSFMETIHLYYFFVKDFTEEKHNFVKNLLIHTEKTLRYVFYSMMPVSFICCTSWMLIPVNHNIQNNYSIHNITARLELGIYFWQPFDFEYNFYGYCISQVIATYCGFVGSIIWVTFDLITVALIFHLTGHITVFKYDLTTAQNKKLTNVEWEKKLKEINVTYSFITKTFKEVEAAFGLTISSIYAQNLFQGGIILYQFTSSGSDWGIILTYGLMIPIFMGMLLVISIVLENVRIQADEIPNLVYDLPWETMSISNQKLVQCIIFQVQPTLEYKAAFNIKTGVQPAINIIKTTFSYYVMIKSRKET